MKKITIFLFTIFLFTGIKAQEGQATLMLDLKKAKASYQIAIQKFENDKKLLTNDAISQDEFNKSKNELLSEEVDYQKLILKLIGQQTYIIVEKAIKYQMPGGDRRVKIVIKNTMAGNQDFLKEFKEYSDIFTPDMKTGKVYNVFVSLKNIENKTIIGSPYEIRIPSINVGETATVDFRLLKDVESVQVCLNYNGQNDSKNIYLEKDSSTNMVDIISNSFAQEIDLGKSASFDLSLERFSNSNITYHLMVVNLPRQITYNFFDGETKSRLSQLRFSQGENTRKLVLKAYMPEREDKDIVIDKAIKFYALVLLDDEYNKIKNIDNVLSEKQIKNIHGGKIKLELIPKGIGHIILRVSDLYHEITVGDSLAIKVNVKNEGTRIINNIIIKTENPLNWKAVIQPDLIQSLKPGKEKEVIISIMPPKDVDVGVQEIKIKTEAQANNRNVYTEDKTVQVKVKAKVPIVGTMLLILLLVGIVIGIVMFGIKISKR
ncbi:MAG: hypothetical protein IMY72_14935 [Bacteroidetes bacterium]|nr:hypothetical protein [Bacteroidota bacterium]